MAEKAANTQTVKIKRSPPPLLHSESDCHSDSDANIRKF